jgi:aspartyl aminopeptidase
VTAELDVAAPGGGLRLGRGGESSAVADDLLTFVDAGPSPSHAVAEMARRLDAAGFSRLDERAAWSLSPGAARYVIREGGTIAAFKVGTADPTTAGFRMVGAHTDSPTFAVRPIGDVRRAGYRLLGVEPYGGLLTHTWLDRDLTLAGRVAVRGPDGEPATRLVHLPGAPLRIPSLAIHLYRELREEGLKLDPQRHLVPVWSHRDGSREDGLAELLADHLGVAPDDILAHDLVTADTQPSARGGADGEWVLAPRLDNLASCHAGVHALTGTPSVAATQVLVANDHEEVGSGSAAGARGSFLEDLLRRIVAVTSGTDAQALPRALASSWLVSSDMAHAVHPNYSERHEAGHRPRLGGGPVIKRNANQAYATNAAGAARFALRCDDADVPVQHFVTRADLPCGSTIGPLTATRLGVPTVDVGNPMLSMHSCREQAAASDVGPLIAALAAHLSDNG